MVNLLNDFIQILLFILHFLGGSFLKRWLVLRAATAARAAAVIAHCVAVYRAIETICL